MGMNVEMRWQVSLIRWERSGKVFLRRFCVLVSVNCFGLLWVFLVDCMLLVLCNVVFLGTIRGQSCEKGKDVVVKQDIAGICIQKCGFSLVIGNSWPTWEID